MRTTALPSMLDILARNYAYHNKAVQALRAGQDLSAPGGPAPAQGAEGLRAAAPTASATTFFTLKGEVEATAAAAEHAARPSTAAQPMNPSYPPRPLRRGSSSTARPYGVLGQIHPLVAKTYGIDAEVYCAELDFTGLHAACWRQRRPIIPCPSSRPSTRDLAMVCDESCTVGQAGALSSPPPAVSCCGTSSFFDIYRGAGDCPRAKRAWPSPWTCGPTTVH